MMNTICWFVFSLLTKDVDSLMWKWNDIYDRIQRRN